MKLVSSLPVATSSATSSIRVSWPVVCVCVPSKLTHCDRCQSPRVSNPVFPRCSIEQDCTACKGQGFKVELTRRLVFKQARQRRSRALLLVLAPASRAGLPGVDGGCAELEQRKTVAPGNHAKEGSKVWSPFGARIRMDLGREEELMGRTADLFQTDVAFLRRTR